MATHLQATQGLEVTQEGSDLGECRHLRFRVRNRSSEPVTCWSIKVRLPNFVMGVYGAQCDALSSTEYQITPTQWQAAMAPSEEREFGVIVGSPVPQPTAA